MTEVYKIVNGIAPPIMNSLFQFRCNTHNIRNFQVIFTENRFLDEFKSKTKAWKCDSCQCRLECRLESIIDNQGRLDNTNSNIQK